MNKNKDVEGASVQSIVRRSWQNGDCIIINDVEQPCSKLIAVIVGQRGEYYECQYLNADETLNQYNKPPMRNKLTRATRVEDFGVVLRTTGDKYWCEQVGDSIATYPDGEPRKWQESGGPYRHTKRPDVFKHVLPF